jgi:hypothetical protein
VFPITDVGGHGSNSTLLCVDVASDEVPSSD